MQCKVQPAIVQDRSGQLRPPGVPATILPFPAVMLKTMMHIQTVANMWQGMKLSGCARAQAVVCLHGVQAQRVQVVVQGWRGPGA